MDGSSSPPAERRLSHSPRLRRRFSERKTVLDVRDTIQEEPEEEEREEEEKQEIEPCNYENLFEAVGEHRFYRRRGPPASPQSSSTTPSSLGARDVYGSTPTSCRVPSLTESPSSVQRRLLTDWEEEESDEEGNHVGTPRTMEAGRRRSSPVNHRTDNESKALEWSQYKAMISKNFKLYNSLDIYILAVFILVGMLIVPYYYSFVKETNAMSYHSWKFEFPGSFGVLKTQNANFWVKLLTGYDGLTPDNIEKLVAQYFGPEFTDALFDTVDKDTLVSHLNGANELGGTAKDYIGFQRDILQVGQRLLRHPIPIPCLGQYVWIHSMMNSAVEHFNHTGSPLGTLHIAPPFPDFEDYLKEIHPSICYDTRYSGCDVLIRVHETSSDALDFILEDIEPTWALLDFSNWDRRYEIRMDPSKLPSTPLGETVLPNSDEYQMYLTSGFLTLQKTIDEYAFVVADRTADDNCYRKALRQTMVTIPMPTHAFTHNTFLSSYGFIVALACIATFLAPTAKLVLAMVGEKEAKLKSMLHVAGVREWLIDLSWYSFAVLQFLTMSCINALLLKLSVLEHIPFFKVLLWVAMSGITVASFAFTFGIVFNEARLAAVLAPALFLATTLPRFLVFGIQRDAKTFYGWVGLFPGSAISFGVDSLLCEYGGEQPEDNIRFLTVISFLLIDSIVIILLGLLFTAIDWKMIPVVVSKRLGLGQPLDEASVASNPSASNSVHTQRSYHQSVPADSKYPMIFIQGLVKKFKQSAVPAIDGIDFTFYRGEIGALLGHNGAGKSTLAWIMAGLMRPSSGDCMIQGVSLYEHWARKHVGVGFCPQENILYDKLTVYQHIVFFAKLHGAVFDKVAVERRARAVGLQDYLYVPVYTLSHGNKRKLSFAIARYGRRFGAIILDEPMAGQDHESRRLCWNCLQKDKESCAVVIVTHNIVEAEQHADQLIVMKDGAFHASGTPRFLRRRFHLPYKLSVTANPIKRKFFQNTVSDYILSFHGLDAKLSYCVGNTYVYHLPLEARGTVPILLDSLDRFVRDKSISSAKLESGPLEDVCRILSEDIDDVLSTNSTMASTEFDDNAEAYGDRIACAGKQGSRFIVEVSWITQVVLMCWKRSRIRGRQASQLALQIFLFASLVALALGVLAVPTFHPSAIVELAPEHGKPGELATMMVGGGSTLFNPYTSEQTMRHEFDAVEASFSAYNVHPKLETSVWNSSAMSRHLYAQRSAPDAAASGAFVLFDVLPLYWDVDWPYYQRYFRQAEQAYEGTIGNWSVETNLDDFDKVLSKATGGTVEITPGLQMATLFDVVIKIAKEAFDSIVQNELTKERPRRSGTTRVLIRSSIHHNSSFPHSIAQYSKAYYDSTFYQCSQQRLARAKSHPLPTKTVKNAKIRVVQGVLAVLLMLVPLCSIAATVVVFHVEEKARKAAFLQIKSGVSISAFWVANYLSDMAFVGLFPFIVLGIMLCYGEDAAMFVGKGPQVVCAFALLFGFSLAVVPFSYLVALQCRSGSAAQLVATTWLFATGLVPLTMMYTIETIGLLPGNIDGLRWLLRLSPSFSLGEGFIELSKFYWLPEYQGVYDSPFASDVSGNAVLSLYGVFIPCFGIFLLLETYGDQMSIMHGREWLLSQQIATKPHENVNQSIEVNSDAVAVAMAVTKVYPRNFANLLSDKLRCLWQNLADILRVFRLSLLAQDLPEVQTCNLQRSPKVAVRNINLTIAKGDTLAIIGASGSGKSTLLSILSGLILPSSGSVENSYGDPMNASKQLRIGFCPQSDPFWDYLTGLETLVIYGRICGIPENQVNKQAFRIMKQVDLEHHADKITLLYCGGNRRKLALGICMMGNPDLLLIDESSSTLDPVAAVKVWKIISEASKDHAVVLATHSSSEAEALSTKISTISNGNLRLRRREDTVNSNILVHVHCHSCSHQSDFNEPVMSMIDAIFPERVLVEHSTSLLKFSLNGSHTLGEIMQRLQSHILTFHCVESFRIYKGGLEFINDSLEEIRIERRLSDSQEQDSATASSATPNHSQTVDRLAI